MASSRGAGCGPAAADAHRGTTSMLQLPSSRRPSVPVGISPPTRFGVHFPSNARVPGVPRRGFEPPRPNLEGMDVIGDITTVR